MGTVTRGFLSRETNHGDIPVKPTTYGGVQFRSRLEARWAIVFDSLGVGWEYEPRTFRTIEGGYLPDFHIFAPKPFWLEIKGPEPIERDYVRAEAVQAETNEKLRFLVGYVPDPPSHGILRTRIKGRGTGRWHPADWRTPWTPVALDVALRRSHQFAFGD